LGKLEKKSKKLDKKLMKAKMREMQQQNNIM